MNILKISCHHVRIPLRVRFAQANQNTQRSNSVVVVLRSQENTLGYGECCPRSYVTGEDVPSVFACLQAWQQELLNTSFETLEDIASWTSAQLAKGYGPAAVCAIELALLDAWSWEYQKDLAVELGAQRSSANVRYTGVLPQGQWTQLGPIVSKLAFPSWKFKAYGSLAPNLHRVRELRTLLGESTTIRMDANAGWTLAVAREQIRIGLELGVTSFEQPLSPADDASASLLVEEFGDQVSIMADESLCTYADAQRLIAERSCNHFSLKLSKNGGLLNTLKIYDLACANGIPCQLSAHYGETSILSAAGLLFAMVAPQLTACEGALGTFLLEEDLAKAPLMVNAEGKIKAGLLPFLGWPVAIDPPRLRRYRKSTQHWNRRAVATV